VPLTCRTRAHLRFSLFEKSMEGVRTRRSREKLKSYCMGIDYKVTRYLPAFAVRKSFNRTNSPW